MWGLFGNQDEPEHFEARLVYISTKDQAKSSRESYTVLPFSFTSQGRS